MSAAPQIRADESYDAELFESDGRQAVRLPSGIHLEGTTAKVRRICGGILIEPKTPTLDRKRTSDEVRAMFDYIDSLGADDLFPNGREQGVAEERLPFD
jgi:virulence-associated protein VagC